MQAEETRMDGTAYKDNAMRLCFLQVSLKVMLLCDESSMPVILLTVKSIRPVEFSLTEMKSEVPGLESRVPVNAAQL